MRIIEIEEENMKVYQFNCETELNKLVEHFHSVYSRATDCSRVSLLCVE